MMRFCLCSFTMELLIYRAEEIILIIREAKEDDLAQLVELYKQLHDNKMPEITPKLQELWIEIQTDKNHHVVVCEVDAQIISSCVLIVVPNLTHNQRPYALIENVITHRQYRGRGYATSVLNFSKEIAAKCNCYKIMLLTGATEERTLKFYEKAGYNKNDKTAFIQWMRSKTGSVKQELKV